MELLELGLLTAVTVCIAIYVTLSYKYIGLVTYYEDDTFVLSEFWYNQFTNKYKLEILCRYNAQLCSVICKNTNVVPLNDMIDSINNGGI